MADSLASQTQQWQSAQVILLAHGSETTPGAAELVEQHAVCIRKKKLFADVRSAFLRGENHPGDIISGSVHPDVYVIPFMISDGYSIDVLIPDALGLKGPLTERVYDQKRQRIHVCHSIGTHPSVTSHIRDNVGDILRKFNLTPEKTAVLVAAHGTPRHPGNRLQTEMLASEIMGHIPDISAVPVFLEESPFVRDWQSLTDRENLIIVPYLMTPGSHATVDVPSAFDINPQDKEFIASVNAGHAFGPHRTNNRAIWYLPIIGHSHQIANIILDRILDRDRDAKRR